MDLVNINLEFDLQHNLPTDVLNILAYMFSKPRPMNIPKLPNHKFFKCTRWDKLVSGNSIHYLFDGRSKLKCDATDEHYALFIKSALKETNDEISLFLDWIAPYIHTHNVSFLGYTNCDKSDEIKLYNFENRTVVTREINEYVEVY